MNDEQETFNEGDLVIAFPYARPPEIKQVGVLVKMTVKRDEDSGGNEWSVLCSDGNLWSIAEFQFRRFIP